MSVQGEASIHRKPTMEKMAIPIAKNRLTPVVSAPLHKFVVQQFVLVAPSDV
jgi:hypothetical protein